jgi:predicted nucleic acid-binding protein
MALNLTIDTNIILDALLKREPWREAAEKIILLAAGKKISASITANTVTDIYYIVNRCTRDKNKAREAVADLAKLMDFTTVDKNDCLKAVNSPVEDYEDALLSVCAAKTKSKFILTRNVKDFEKSTVKAITPDEFLSQF